MSDPNVMWEIRTGRYQVEAEVIVWTPTSRNRPYWEWSTPPTSLPAPTEKGQNKQ